MFWKFIRWSKEYVLCKFFIVNAIERIKIPTFTDERGDLSVLEFHHFVEWDAKRIYYVTGTKKDRGGHAVREEKKIYICAQGTMTAKIHDGKEWHEFAMHGPNEAVVMNDMCWREFKDFSEGAVLIVASNMK